LEAAIAKNTAVVFVYPENANHVLKHEPTPREELTAQVALGYNASDAELDQEVINSIVGWLKKQA